MDEVRYHYPTAKCWQDTLSGGRWIVSPWDETIDIPVGPAIGRGDTPEVAWADANRRIERRLDAGRDRSDPN